MTSVMSVQWHEESLVNAKGSLERLRAERASLGRQVYILTRSIQYARAQIERAKAEGKEAYDPDRYLPHNKYREAVLAENRALEARAIDRGNKP